MYMIRIKSKYDQVSEELDILFDMVSYYAPLLSLPYGLDATHIS